MPYIPQESRAALALVPVPENVGELNYCIMKMVLEYIANQEGVGRQSYSIYNGVLGVLSAVDKELYRKVIAPYEDVKCIENGEVF